MNKINFPSKARTLNKAKRLLIGLLMASSLSLVPAAKAALPAAITGAWYNPAQSGHGLTVQILDPERALVFWHAFDPDGNPLTLYIGTAYAPRGMQFGEFDPRALEFPVWGSITLSFDTCSRARLEWQPQQAGFSPGQLELERLAAVLPTFCDLPPPNDLVSGLYEGVIERAANNRAGGVGIGVVDGEGRLWAMETFHGERSARGEVPGPRWNNYVEGRSPPFESLSQVMLALPQADARVAATVGNPAALIDSSQYAGQSAQAGHWSMDSITIEPGNNAGIRRQIWAPASASLSLVQPLQRETLSGEYQIPFDPQHDAEPGVLRIDERGAICLQPEPSESTECRYQGRAWFPDGELGLFDFELKRQDGKLVRNLHGRGWMVDGPQGRVLYMVAVGPSGGLGLVAY